MLLAANYWIPHCVLAPSKSWSTPHSTFYLCPSCISFELLRRTSTYQQSKNTISYQLFFSIRFFFVCLLNCDPRIPKVVLILGSNSWQLFHGILFVHFCLPWTRNNLIIVSQFLLEKKNKFSRLQRFEKMLKMFAIYCHFHFPVAHVLMTTIKKWHSKFSE